MRNVIIGSICMFLAMVTGAYCIAWYSQATALKNAIEQSLNTLNASQKLITYDALEASGFPTNLYVSIFKPHFHGRVDVLLKSLQPTPPEPNPANPQTPVLANPFASMPAWEEDDVLDGKIIFGVNAMSESFTMSIQGNWLETSKLADKTNTLNHTQSGNTTCVLQLQRGTGMLSTLWNFDLLTRFQTDPASLLKDFRKIDCAQNGNTVIDQSNNATLATSGPLRVYATNTVQTEAHQIRFYLKATDMEITPQGDAMTATYIQSFYPGYPYPLNFSIYGKQNAEIDFTFEAPINTDKADGNTPVHIALEKLDMTNAVYNHHMTFKLDNHATDNIRTAKIQLNSESNFNEQYDTLVQNNLRGLIQQAYSSNDPRFSNLQGDLKKYTPDQLYAIIYPALFSFHALGKVTENIDATYQGTTDFTTGTATLANLDLSSSLYGLKANGSAKLAQKFPQEGNLTISCANCLQMIDDIAAYSQRVQKVVSYFAPEKTDIAIDANKADGIKRFLSTLTSANKNGTDSTTLTFNIAGSLSSGITINGRNLGEIMSMVGEYLKPAAK